MKTNDHPTTWASYSSPCGELLLGVRAGKLVCCDWQVAREREGQAFPDILPAWSEAEEAADWELLRQAIDQLAAYFRGERQTFDFPLVQEGTPFQQAVWKVLREIPYGAELTYGEVAQRAGYPKAYQAVGSAVGANRLSIFIPCHRVVAQNGRFSGFRGGRLAKEYLVDLERRSVGHGACLPFDL